ncbi:sugar phosphate isomerase/epimerase family protein [Marasmitruncus massiliensis]|uniref:sugar phosphate isomerase/epimerase family protein n=1 Tax=Marasmitruncus massiliensis TaxID=1944642 RepID=UPI000C7C2643|nr:sugar phosphate isomerase/epimerase [Marasmitruncus massiliensis]
MLAGISTACFYPELTERALACISEFGAQAAEIFFNAPSELEDSFTRQLKAVADGSGTQILSVHPFTSGLEPLLFFTEYRRRTLDGLELYKRYFHAANMLGAKIFVLHGDRREATKPYRRYFEMFEELAETGRSMGITVAQENVPRCASYCPEFFTAMANALPDARFVLDTKQCVRAGYSVTQMLDAMGDRIVHLHISDHNEKHDCLPVGKGILNLAELIAGLKRYRYDGGLVLEVYRDNYGAFSELKDSYRYLFEAVYTADA